MEEHSVAIVGAGAVGQMLAFFLKSTNISTVLCYGRQGIVPLKQTVVYRGQRHLLETESEGAPASLWLFAVKAYDLKDALDQWLIQIPLSAKIVFLCNGYLEPELKHLRKRFAGSNIRKGVVSRGARFADDGSLEIGDQGSIRWGDAIHKASHWEKAIFEGLEREGFAWDVSICDARKEKWFFNTVMNSLAAVYRLPRNGDIAALSEYSPLSEEVFRLGGKLWPDWKASFSELQEKMQKLIAMTADNENSMARDRRLGRQTEAAFLSGYVLRQGDAEKDFPLLTRLHQELAAETGH